MQFSKAELQSVVEPEEKSGRDDVFAVDNAP
jgi:hypothetical protein